MQKALNTTQKAFLKITFIRKAKKRLENYTVRKINKVVPLSKQTLIVIGSTALTIKEGKLDTKVIKKMNLKVLGGKIRPDLMYNFQDNIFRGLAVINWSF